MPGKLIDTRILSSQRTTNPNVESEEIKPQILDNPKAATRVYHIFLVEKNGRSSKRVTLVEPARERGINTKEVMTEPSRKHGARKISTRNVGSNLQQPSISDINHNNRKHQH